MVFGKILNKKAATDKVGNKSGNLSKGGQSQLGTYITASGYADGPSAQLENKLTVGSEVGDFIIADDSISPRHCTFFLNQNVISVLDHSSNTGTFINKKKIDPGKMFILSDKDKIKLGKIQIEIEHLEIPEVEEETEEEHFEDNTSEFREMAVDLNPPPTPPVSDDPYEADTQTMIRKQKSDESRSEVENFDDIDVEEEDLDESVLSVAIKLSHDELNATRVHQMIEEDDDVLKGAKIETKDPTLKLSKPGESLERDPDLPASPRLKAGGKRGRRAKPNEKVKIKKAKVTADPSSSFLTRCFGSLNDVIISLIVLEIFLVFKDFENFYRSFYLDVWKFLKPYYNEFVLPYYQMLVKEVPEVDKMIFSFFDAETLKKALPFITLFFVIRVATGILLSVSIGQLIIGMRSRGKFIWKRLAYPLREILGILLFPFLIFDLPTLFSKRSFKEVITFTQYVTPKPQLAVFSAVFITPLLFIAFGVAPLFKGLEMNSPVPVSVNQSKIKPYQFEQAVYIESLDLTLPTSDTIKLLPTFILKNIKGKKILRTGVLLADLESGATLDLFKIKKFNFDDLYLGFVNNNILSEYFQPTIYTHAKNIELSQKKDFKKSKVNYKKLSEETEKLLIDTYRIDPSYLFRFGLENGLIMSGFRDFREKFDNLFADEIQAIEVITIGNSRGALMRFSAGKNAYYHFVPLGEEQGKIFSTTTNFSDKKALGMRNKIHLGQKKTTEGEAKLLTNYPIANFINNLNAGKTSENLKLFEAVYVEYKNILRSLMIDQKSFLEFERQLQQLINILNYLNEESKNKVYTKTILTFTELLSATREMDYPFFGLEPPLLDSPAVENP